MMPIPHVIMHSCVARPAKSYAVIDTKTKLWKFFVWLDVMHVGLPLRNFAMLACVVVSIKNSLPPIFERNTWMYDDPLARLRMSRGREGLFAIIGGGAYALCI